MKKNNFLLRHRFLLFLLCFQLFAFGIFFLYLARYDTPHTFPLTSEEIAWCSVSIDPIDPEADRPEGRFGVSLEGEEKEALFQLLTSHTYQRSRRGPQWGTRYGQIDFFTPEGKRVLLITLFEDQIRVEHLPDFLYPVYEISDGGADLKDFLSAYASSSYL